MARKGSAPFSASTSASIKAKPKAKPARKLDPSNAYTYLPSLPKRHRTGAAQNSLTKEELADAGPSRRVDSDDEEDGDDGEDMQKRVRKLAMMIADDENPGQVDESEDSDVDSDEAWGSEGSDEERWGDVFRDLDKGKGKKGKSKAKEVVRKPAKPLTVNLDESDEDERPKVKSKGKGNLKAPALSEEDDGDDADDISIDDEGSEGDSEEEEEDNEDYDDDEDVEDSDVELPSDLSDEEDPDTLADLDAFVDQLASADKKRKAGDEEPVQDASKKRRVLPVVSGPGLQEGGDMALRSNQKLDLSSLISSHPSLSGASALLPAKSDKKESASILKQGLVPAPLPTVVQERLDREAAYEKTKEEGQKWAGVMKRVKEAEHLSFPLQAKDRGGVKSGNEMLAGFKPENKLESAVTALLNQANLTEKNLTEKEDLALEAQELTLEEIKERRTQLRYQRELLFRAEAKAKRVAKIKSKTFRKLARKRAAKDNTGVSLKDLERLDPEKAEEEREKLERERARERATLRHGAKSGRWARDVGGDAGELEDRRRAKEDMLDRKEKLQRKIMGQGEGSDSESESEEDEDDDEGVLKSRAFDQLAALNAAQKEEAERAKGGKGLMQMAFMKKAQDRKMKQVAEEEADLRRDIEMFGQEKGSDEDEESDDEDEEGRPAMMRVGGNEGRMVFAGPTPGTASPSLTQQVSEPAQPVRRSALSQSTRDPSPPLSDPVLDHNPWLIPTSGTAGPSRKRNAPIGSQNAKGEEKATRALKKVTKGREAEVEDERVEIEVDGSSLLRKKASEKVNNGKAKAIRQAVTEGSEDEDEDEDGDELMPVNGVKAFKQRDLVAEAFAGDNVVEDFAKEKQRQVEADAPTVEDTSLPGWGSWGGKGSRKRKHVNPKFLKKTAGIEPSSRKDFTRSNVIITEKKDKKASSFLIKDLPYPYTSKEQYEKSFQVPVGSEWNSRVGYQRETVPRVVKKPGAIIEPVQRLF
ncbi:hypothetical protein IAR55_000599 [Kwoniella newhampshirensis]|uniref:U3 small nucleolar RNA-associated protein 14 n=1 Tax=Kwoniella newhampshirensis TaxID=1651941 RepID=A0AAW0Z868_9TREE